MADDISNETRKMYAATPLFLINKIFGFPFSLFIPYDPVNAEKISFFLIVLYIANCWIQFSILSFIWRILRRR